MISGAYDFTQIQGRQTFHCPFTRNYCSGISMRRFQETPISNSAAQGQVCVSGMKTYMQTLIKGIWCY